MAKDYEVSITEPEGVYNFELNGNNIHWSQLPDPIPMTHLIEAIDIALQIKEFYDNADYDGYVVTRTGTEATKPNYYDIKMNYQGNVKRGYRWHDNDLFDFTQMENDVSITEFQQNNTLNRNVGIYCDQHRTSLLSFTIK